MTDPRPVTQLAWPSAATLAMPGSKSSANRLLIAAAAVGQRVSVHGVTASDDVLRLLGGLRTLGFAVETDADDAEVVVGPRHKDAPTHGTIDCGNGGTTLRFLLSLAAITPGDWVLTGDAAMQRRPIRELVDAWRRLGADVTDSNGCPPVRVRCVERSHGGPVVLDASRSSQFVSSLLLVAPALRDGLAMTCTGPVASADYVGLTRAVLSRFGAHSFATTGAITVRPGFHRVPDVVQVAGDWSSFGVWTCLGHLTHSRVETSNLDIGSGQPDESLATMLAAIPPTGELVLDVTPMPDQFPNLAIVAAHRAGRTRFVGGANLRLKECDRIAVMARELTRAGAAVEERPDGMVVHGGRPLRPIVVDPANDHRIAIAWALAGMLSPGISIAQPDCVAKSYPGFWNDLDAVVRMRRCVAVVGMRGAGKSTFGRAFAEHTGAAFCDTDEMFVQQHGPIAAFVADQGWPAFRREEARVVEAAVRAGRIVGLGGGAIETAATRELLREQTVVVWLDADADLLRARLQADPRVRPSVTGAPVLEEIETLLVRRTPLFAELATVRLDATLPTAQQVEQALRELGRSCRWPSDTRPA